MTEELAASYSLGFVPEERKLGQVRQISVRLAPGTDKGRRIEYRRTYRDKSLDERLAERLLSVAYLGNPENPLGARVDFGGTTPLEKKVHELTVGVDVPAESIVTLPGKDGEARNATTQLRLWMVAVGVRDETTGVMSLVREPVSVPTPEAGAAAN